MVDSMKQSFLLKPEVLTPNRNGFMAKKRMWHLKAGSTVSLLNEKVGFIIPTTRTRTFSMSARRFSEVGAVQFRRRVGIEILLGWWLGV